VAGGTAASAASAVQVAIAGGDAPAVIPSALAAMAGGGAPAAAASAPAVAGGDAAVGAEGPVARAGGDTALGYGLPTFHVFGPRGHVMTDAAVPGLGDVGNNPNYIQRGSTAHFVVFYDSALGGGASAADAVLGKCEADFDALRGWFSNTTPGSLPFNIYITTASNGASHASCSSTTLYLGANSSNPINNAFVLQLLIAEEDEVFEAAFGHGWNCAASNGEGLSRVLPTIFIRASSRPTSSLPRRGSTRRGAPTGSTTPRAPTRTTYQSAALCCSSTGCASSLAIVGPRLLPPGTTDHR
jgi:hypothetical protein